MAYTQHGSVCSMVHTQHSLHAAWFHIVNFYVVFHCSTPHLVPLLLQVQPVEVPGITPSFHQYHVEQVAADIKESLCRVSDNLFDEKENTNIPNITYEVSTEAHLNGTACGFDCLSGISGG